MRPVPRQGVDDLLEAVGQGHARAAYLAGSYQWHDGSANLRVDAQYRTARGGRPPRALRPRPLLVTGSEAAEFLQGQLTNDVEALEPGAGCYAALLDRKGKIRADMRVLRLATTGS